MEINQILSNEWSCSVFCKLVSKKSRDWVNIEITSRWWTVEFSVDREILWSIVEQLKKADELLHKENSKRVNG